MATLSGTTKDSSNNYVQRFVRVYRRDTGAYVGQTLSDPTTGAWSITTADTTEHFAIMHDVIADPYWANVVLAMRMDGSNGGTTFTDLKGKTVTRVGTPTTSTAQVRYGTASAYFNGSTDALDLPAGSDFAFGTGDFTVAMNTYINGSSALFSTGLQSTSQTGIEVYYDGAFIIRTGWGSRSTTYTCPSLWGAWKYIEVRRTSGAFSVAVDNTTLSVASTVGGGMDSSVNLSNNQFRIGSIYTNVLSIPMNGYIDEIVVTKGVSRPSRAYNLSVQFPAAVSGGTENAVILDRLIPV